MNAVKFLQLSERTRFPRSIDVNPTAPCNLHCSFCWGPDLETLVTQVKWPLPPTHAAAFIAAGYWMILRDANLEAANQWLSWLEPRVRENYREIDRIVDTYYKNNPEKRDEDIQGFDPADSPVVQGLPDAVTELERVGLADA